MRSSKSPRLFLLLCFGNGMWCSYFLLPLVFLKFGNFANAVQLKSFPDTNLYDFEWIEHDAQQIRVISIFFALQKRTPEEIARFHGPLAMRSSNNESYNCYIPNFVEAVGQTEKNDDATIPSLTPEKVLQALIDRKVCMLKIEGYWIYELCHGRHLRQFHQELIKPKILAVTKEYMLGLAQTDASTSGGSKESGVDIATGKFPLLTWDGKDLPYFQAVYDQGTPCDLRNNEPRTSNIRFVCFEDAPDSILQIKETATCEYEVVVSVRSLCIVQGFAPKKTVLHKIQCYANSPSYITPAGIKKMHDEIFLSRGHLSTVERRKTTTDSDDLDDGDIEEEEEPDTAPENTKLPLPQTPWEHAAPSPSPSRRVAQYSPDEQDILNTLSDFIDGAFCVHGGSGYWKHSYCFGKTVIQYHEESDGTMKNENVITLGVWDEATHLEWIEHNPQKKPSSKTTINFYHDGDICDLTGLPRNAEVKLKCVNPSDHTSSSVALYLLEPKPCSYILGVESRMFCYLMPYVNSEGVVDVKAFKRDVQQNYKELN
ncbi:endoplasmic reticulum lectin 1-like isoform X2 [Paramacrobiotus metropolitanus]|uniref:endoplasmic reticulum lectin 1-like isoform X2 n=1 Tax=Paramacrobiotus metropolitanus TaxID=2943436 RepID=UPI0024461479|nr:endoplasmic reticulum lectin 1-like isoform X2 [Paramacrobiotus metropolitanus]